MTLDIWLIALVVGCLIAFSYLYGFFMGQIYEARNPGKARPFGKAKKNGKGSHSR